MKAGNWIMLTGTWIEPKNITSDEGNSMRLAQYM